MPHNYQKGLKKFALTPNAEEEAEKLDHSHITWGECKAVGTSTRKSMTVSYQTCFPSEPATALWGIYPEK